MRLTKSRRTDGWGARLGRCLLLFCVCVSACLEFPGWQDGTEGEHAGEGEGEGEGEGSAEGEGEGPDPPRHLVGGLVVVGEIAGRDGRYTVRQSVVAGPARICSDAQVCVTGGIQP